MGLFDWFARHGLPKMIAKNAIKQYGKWRKRCPEMSEAEIADGIFATRYFNSKGVLDQEDHGSSNAWRQW